MPKCKLTFRDAFSFAITVKEHELTEEQYNQIKDNPEKVKPVQRFTDGINWIWQLEKVEILNQ